MLKTTESNYIETFQKGYLIPNSICADLNLKRLVQHTKSCFEKLDNIKVDENVRHFSNRLNKSVFGNSFYRYGKRLKGWYVFEGGRYKHPHIHAIIERPERINKYQFSDLIIKCWMETKFGYGNNRVAETYDYPKRVNYMLKSYSKEIDLESSIHFI